MAKDIIKKIYKKLPVKKIVGIAFIFAFIIAGLGVIWISSFNLPDLNSFEKRQVIQSTKIYDRTGEVVLFDIHGDIKRTVVPFEEISDHMKKATVAIEDATFYEHNGIKISSIFRAILKNIRDGNLLGGQGGSTITQQVIKNALLTSDKKVSRKIKEWVLAPRLEKQLTKDQILGIYLNEVPFGGTVYGVQEAARHFFGKDAKDLTLVESAYLAALPQAPTFYSPYGNNPERLEARKNLVLEKMLENSMITQAEYDSAMEEIVTFEKQESFGIKAPHFVMYIREQIEEKYGKEVVEEGGLKVITTLDYELQKKAEEIVEKYALENEEKYNAENASISVVDPQTGQILTMVGSRNYFDDEIDGNVNIATAKRQPGSSIKPIIYAEAFNKGYLPETVVFDVKTEFSVSCAQGGNCYSPSNYDGQYRGPISLKNALAQSINIPAVKAFYLAGLNDALTLAKNMGLETLTNIRQYGLTLVLGGGEVRPIDMASAYGVFANDGIREPLNGVLLIEDRDGNKLEEFKTQETRVLPKQTALQIANILSDNSARAPMFGGQSSLYFSNASVAAKTGTTNDYRDAWVIGFTPKLSVVAWAGNNDNSSMNKLPSVTIAGPMWHEFFVEAMKLYPSGTFESPQPAPSDTKSILKGNWQIGGSDDDYDYGDIHTILHWVDKNNPNGPVPNNPQNDPQYSLWEAGLRNWLKTSNLNIGTKKPATSEKATLNILSPDNNGVYDSDKELVISALLSQGSILDSEVIINGEYIGKLDPVGSYVSFIPEEVDYINNENTVVIKATNTVGESFESSIKFSVK